MTIQEAIVTEENEIKTTEFTADLDEIKKILETIANVKNSDLDCLKLSSSWRIMTDYCNSFSVKSRNKVRMAFESKAFEGLNKPQDAKTCFKILKDYTSWSSEFCIEIVLIWCDLLGFDRSTIDLKIENKIAKKLQNLESGFKFLFFFMLYYIPFSALGFIKEIGYNGKIFIPFGHDITIDVWIYNIILIMISFLMAYLSTRFVNALKKYPLFAFITTIIISMFIMGFSVVQICLFTNVLNLSQIIFIGVVFLSYLISVRIVCLKNKKSII